MSALVLFIAAIAIPVFLLYIFQVEASMVYLSLCMGYVLVRFMSPDAVSLISGFYPKETSLSMTTVKLILLLLPAVLTMVAMFHSVHGTKRIINIIPSAACGILLIALIEPQLPSNISTTMMNSNYWTQYSHFETLLIGAGSLVCLGFLWTNRKPKHSRPSKGSH
jgi:hypothetical protein